MTPVVPVVAGIGDETSVSDTPVAQAAQVVAEVLQQSGPGDNVVVEAGLSLAALEAPISSAVAEVGSPTAHICPCVPVLQPKVK